MEKIKVGMLSFHESFSYGATLQCFALQNIVSEMGYDCEFINFNRSKYFLLKRNNKNNKSTLKSKLISFSIKLQSLIQKRNNQLMYKAFSDFKEKYFIIGTTEYTTIEEIYNLNFDYQIFITGSDQVWNPLNSVLEVYGLGFVPQNINTIAYAASIGVSKIPETKKENMINLISGVRHISCREFEGALELEKLLGRKIPNVIDPTLLINKNRWIKYESSTTLPEKYVLCFFLGSLKYPRKVARRIAKKNHCKIIIIPGSPRDMFQTNKIAKGCGPREFLELFHKASFICTDSFHGTAFAINMNVPFYSFCRRGYEDSSSFISRIKDLLEMLGLSNRLVYPRDKIDYDMNNINWSNVNYLIENERSKSLQFLRDSLKG